MTMLAWPLQANTIRRDSTHNAFGMVRDGGKRVHQGWDLYARALTPCYAVTDGLVKWQSSTDYGNVLLLRFEHRGQFFYAAYCHLTVRYPVDGKYVRRGDVVGVTGNTGNAKTMTGEDQHLHFEIRTTQRPPAGTPAGRLDPALFYGRAPIGWTFYESHGMKIAKSIGGGLRVKGLNVRDRIE
jgi:murein DD-endopeptidase MepM/ murein hydrolase activator NlpD